MLDNSEHTRLVNIIQDINSHDGVELEYDDAGQVVFYTGIFVWQDGSFHTRPETYIDEDDEFNFDEDLRQQSETD